MREPKVGDRIPNLPPEYEQKQVMPDGAALMLAVDNCPSGTVLFVNESIITHIAHFRDLDYPDGPFDCVIINPNDIDEEVSAEIEKNRITPKLNS